MSDGNDFILERGIATRAAQGIITATWQWDEKTLAEWDAAIAAFLAQKEVVSDKEAIKTAAAGILDASLDVLHERTQVGLSLFKVKNRDNAAMTHMLKMLRAEGGSRGRILEEALDFESQWEKWAPAWEPRPAETLADFNASREECLELKEPYAESKGVWRKEAEDYNQLGIALNKLCKAWYEAATTVFKEGTSEGDMIRGTIPTTYTPAPELALPSAVTLTLVGAVGSDGMEVSYSAEDAATYDVYLKGPGDTIPQLIAANRTATTYTYTGLAAGDYEASAIASNATGSGPTGEAEAFTIA